MKLVNSFYLLLALPLLLAACSKENESDNHAGYFMEDTLIMGKCERNADEDENQFPLAFVNESGNLGFVITLVGAEGDKALKAGIYTAADQNLLLDNALLADVATLELYDLEGGSGTAIVEGDENNYKIDFVVSDAENREYHFTYDGKIYGISPAGDLPTEPQSMVAEHITGYALSGDIYNYYFTLSDKGFNEYEIRQANGNYYQVDIFGVEGELDADGNITIPVGTYTLDKSNSQANNTMQYSASAYSQINEDGTEINIDTYYEDAQLVVTEDGMTLTVIIGGVEHTVTYNKAPKIRLLI